MSGADRNPYVTGDVHPVHPLLLSQTARASAQEWMKQGWTGWTTLACGGGSPASWTGLPAEVPIRNPAQNGEFVTLDVTERHNPLSDLRDRQGGDRTCAVNDGQDRFAIGKQSNEFRALILL